MAGYAVGRDGPEEVAARVRERIVATAEGIAAGSPALGWLAAPAEDPKALARALAALPGQHERVLWLAGLAQGERRPAADLEGVQAWGGQETLRGLVLVAELAGWLRRPVPGYDLDAGVLWNRSLCLAAGAVDVRRRLGGEPLPELFAAAVLADLGKHLLGEFLATHAAAIDALAFGQGIPFDKAERRVLGLDHGEVGALLLERWHAPPALVDAVRCHHRPERAEVGYPLAESLHIAEVVCLMVGVGCGHDGLNYRTSPRSPAQVLLVGDSVEELFFHVLDEGRALASYCDKQLAGLP